MFEVPHQKPCKNPKLLLKTKLKVLLKNQSLLMYIVTIYLFLIYTHIIHDLLRFVLLSKMFFQMSYDFYLSKT
jgi:hypothetical protein